MKNLLLILGLVSMVTLTACGTGGEGEMTDGDASKNEKVGLPDSEVPEESNDEYSINLENALEELEMVE